MLKAQLFPDKKAAPHILCLGAHCDDIEIGCGGAILSLLDGNPNTSISWIVFSSNEDRKKEATLGASLFTEKAKKVDLQIYDFRDGFLPYSGEAVKDTFEKIKRQISPDLIFTHYRKDLHQDHRLVSDLTWNTFRNHLILEYEIPKWDGDIGTPDSYVHLTQDIGRKKIDYLQQAYNSQKAKAWFTDDLFWSLMRIRGMESNSPSSISESFYSRKSVLEI